MFKGTKEDPGATGQSTPMFALVGPTAVGKSEVALLLADRLGGEIISVDSMQVYCGLDIGTAKPSAGELARVPHHLINVAEITEAFDAARFVEMAQRAALEIRQRGRIPIFCGGTGLYLKAFFEGLGETPPANPELRAELSAAPAEDLLREVAERDPELYATIDHKNVRRLIRAVEVIRLTGKPFSAQKAAWKSRSQAQSMVTQAPLIFGLERGAEDLRRRIEVRVDRMFERGLVEETKELLQHGLAQNIVVMQALGYRQVVEHLNGLYSLPEAIALVKARTRRFAKRQMTWFRRQLTVRWISWGETQSAAEIGEQIGREIGTLASS